MRRPEAEYHVIVAGGGAGGVGAALGAAESGAPVLLVEKDGFLGGAATNAQALAHCGVFEEGPEPVNVVGGVAEAVLGLSCQGRCDERPFTKPALCHCLDARSGRRTAHTSPESALALLLATTRDWIILLEAEAVKLALDRLLARHGVDVLLHTRVAAVTCTAERIEAVELAGMEGRSQFVAEAFADATGDADLALLAGLPCRTDPRGA